MASEVYNRFDASHKHWEKFEKNVWDISRENTSITPLFSQSF